MRYRWTRYDFYTFESSLVHMHPIQTLTTLGLSGNRIRSKGTMRLANGLRMNTVRQLTCISIILCSSFFHNRDSQHWIFHTTRSESKEHTIWQICCPWIKWGSFCRCYACIVRRCCIQTLTKLDLECNHIGDVGAGLLMDGLKTNKVRKLWHTSIIC